MLFALLMPSILFDMSFSLDVLFVDCRYIRAINRQNLNYKLAPNHLVDLTDEEYDGHAGW